MDEAGRRRRQDSGQAQERDRQATLGGVAKAKADFIAAGVGQFGSGWCWISPCKDGKLSIDKTPNGESPLVKGATPILGCDVWEHSYYIDYRNARPKYLEAFWDSLINWEDVDQMSRQAPAAAVNGLAAHASPGTSRPASRGPVLMHAKPSIAPPPYGDGSRKYASTGPFSLMVSGLPLRSSALPAATRIQPSLTQYSSTLVFSCPAKRMPMPRSSNASS